MQSYFQRKKDTTLSHGKRSVHEHVCFPPVMGRILNHRFEVREDRCFGCAACIALCPVDVLHLEQRMIYVREEDCTHCRLCIPSCPVFALEINRVDA